MRTALWIWLCAGVAIAFLAACAPAVKATATGQIIDTGLGGTTAPTASLLSTEVIMALELTSPSFEEGGTIPRDFACTGANGSPELNWSDPPAATKSFALIFNDPDAGSRGFVHWVIFNMPADARSLPAGTTPNANFDGTTIQGTNSWGRLGYGGPCPPEGSTHNYVFTLYALDAELDLGSEATKDDLLAAMNEHILAEASLSARFAR